MKHTKYVLSSLILVLIALSFVPYVTPQVGTYMFHGVAGDTKILKVRTADNSSLNDLFGSSYVSVLQTAFGVGCLEVGAQKKSLVTAVDISAVDPFFGYPAANYTTDNWKWTTGAFPSSPDDGSGINVTSLYNPHNITAIVNYVFSQNVTLQNAAIYFAQLPTPVDQYLGAIVWAPKWQNVGNTVVHNAEQGDYGVLPTFALFQYLQNCTEIWTYDTTYGAWIGYQILDNTGAVIYEFSIELPQIPAIPGFEIPILLGVAAIGIIYVIKKRK
jgi:hypothetical protein